MQDRYAYGRTTPSIDVSQDWILTGGGEKGGSTTLQFERKLDTCDPDDIAINFVSYTYTLLVVLYMYSYLVYSYVHITMQQYVYTYHIQLYS